MNVGPDFPTKGKMCKRRAMSLWEDMSRRDLVEIIPEPSSLIAWVDDEPALFVFVLSDVSSPCVEHG